MRDSSYWDRTWARKHERYNAHHGLIWKAIEPHVRGNVLDLGCGPCVLYEGKDVQLTGVDWSVEALNQARLRVPTGTFIQASVLESGLPSAQFDTVLMLGLLDYFEDWGPVVCEAKRLAKPGGKIVATLLHGFLDHDWNLFPKITGNWRLLEIQV